MTLEGSISEKSEYEKRERVCDLGYLRTSYMDAQGKIGFRCPSEVIDIYLKKGGTHEETIDRKCLCNGLLATIGLAQVRGNYLEPPIVTAGKDLSCILRFLKTNHRYSAADVIAELLLETNDCVTAGQHENAVESAK